MALGWQHHTLIQSLLSRGPTSEKKFYEMFHGITGKDPATHQAVLNDALLKINKQLSYIQFELRGCRNQYDGEVFWGVVNKLTDEQSKLGTKYTVIQLAFYKGIIEAIVQDAEAQGSISSIEALNLRLESQVVNIAESQSQGAVPAALKYFSISQKEKTLDEFICDGWLCKTTDGNIGLGNRSFLDLRSWLQRLDVVFCEVCNEAGVKAELCRNPDCKVRIHQYCLKKKFSQRRVEPVCPGCKTPWPYTRTEAEAVEEEEQPSQQMDPETQPTAGPSRKRQRSVKSEMLNKEGADSSQPSARETRRSSRLR